MPLQADPTVQYAIQLETGARKPRLFNARLPVPLALQHLPRSGPPAGPGGAPSRASIEAVLAPADVPYLYFVGTGDGRHAFQGRTPSISARSRASGGRLAAASRGGPVTVPGGIT